MLTGEVWKMIRELKNSGLNVTQISKTLNIDRKTVRKALNSNSVPKYKIKKLDSILNNFKKYIEDRLEKYNLTSQKIYEELLTQEYKGKYGIVNNYVKKIKSEYKTKAILRFETIPGEQAQVDWAYFGEFYDQEKRKLVRLCCFVMILGFSRTKFIHFFDGDNTHNFLEGHNLAFKFFGGFPREILYDNLKSVVLKRAFKQSDCDFNKEFLEFSGYYGFKAVLAQPYRPQTKGKVEVTVRFIRENFFEGTEFKSINEINQNKLDWLNKVNNLIHYTTHEKPNERLKKENLIPVTGKFYDLSKIYYRKIQSDCHLSFKSNFYSCPLKYAGKEVSLKEINNHIYVYYRDENITIHKLEESVCGKYITSTEHKQEIQEQSKKQTQLAWKNKKKLRENKNKIKNNLKCENKSSYFDSSKIINLYKEVEERNLKIYEEVLQ